MDKNGNLVYKVSYDTPVAELVKNDKMRELFYKMFEKRIEVYHKNNKKSAKN